MLRTTMAPQFFLRKDELILKSYVVKVFQNKLAQQ